MRGAERDTSLKDEGRAGKQPSTQIPTAETTQAKETRDTHEQLYLESALLRGAHGRVSTAGTSERGSAGASTTRFAKGCEDDARKSLSSGLSESLASGVNISFCAALDGESVGDAGACGLTTPAGVLARAFFSVKSAMTVDRSALASTRPCSSTSAVTSTVIAPEPVSMLTSSSDRPGRGHDSVRATTSH
jgi:hypothetical protein